MTEQTIPVEDIREGDEFHSPSGQHHWTAVEPAYHLGDETHVQVQYWPDGGIGPERIWTGKDAQYIVIHRSDPLPE